MSNTVTPTPAIKVGDHFVASWGYDQTNIDFYEVVGFTPSGKSVRLREVHQRWLDDCHVVPEPGTFFSAHEDSNDRDQTITKRIRWVDYSARGDHPVPLVKVDFGTAQLWSGQPRYVTPYGQGH